MECFRLLFEHLAWIEHQFLCGIRDSRTTGSLWGMMRGVWGSKEVNTPELIGQINNFLDKHRHVSIETLSAHFHDSVGTVHTIIREELMMRKICAKFVPRVLTEDQQERRCHDFRKMVEQNNSHPAVFDALVTCDENWICYYDPETKRQSSQWKHAGSPRPKKARESKSTHKPLMIPFFFDSTGMIYMHWVPTWQTVNKEYYVEVLREFMLYVLSDECVKHETSGHWHNRATHTHTHAHTHAHIYMYIYIYCLKRKKFWNCIQ